MLRKFVGFLGGIGTGAGDHRHPALRFVDAPLDDAFVLVVAHRRAFAGGADRNQTMGSLGDLPVHQRAEGRLVERAAFERRDQGCERASKIRLGCHEPLRTPFACSLNQIPTHTGSHDQAKGPRWSSPQPRFRRGDGADTPTRRIWYFVHIFNQIDLELERPNDSPRRNVVTQSSRVAALRSMAWATCLALAVGLSSCAADAVAKSKVPLPKARPIARNIVPKTK